MVRDRVVDARADAVLLAQGGGETIAVRARGSCTGGRCAWHRGDVWTVTPRRWASRRRRCPDVCARPRADLVSCT